jgi:hypothetical protein
VAVSIDIERDRLPALIETVKSIETTVSAVTALVSRRWIIHRGLTSPVPNGWFSRANP